MSAVERPAIQQLLQKLESLDTDFKSYHFTILDLIEEQEVLENEQATLDEHDDRIAKITNHIQKLLLEPSAKPLLEAEKHQQIHNWMDYLKRKLRIVSQAIEPMVPGLELDS